jgi:hypothetical protein
VGKRAVDYALIKSLFPVSMVLQRVWGIVAVRHDCHGAHGRCPMCGHSPRSDTLSWSGQLWYCHRCAKGGSVVDLYAQAFGLPVYVAAVELCRRMERRDCWRRFRRPRTPRQKRNRDEAR